MNEHGVFKMTVESYDTVYSAQVGAEATLDRVMGRVVVPLLLSAGYLSKSIAELFVDGLPTHWDDIYDFEDEGCCLEV